MTLSSLDACSAYYVQVSAVNCGTRITSDTVLLDLLDYSPFSVTLSLTDIVTSCDAWVASSTNIKVMDLENALMVVPLQRCTHIPCLAYSRLTCTDSTKANFR